MAGLSVELDKISKGLIVHLEKVAADKNNLPTDINVTLALDVSGSMLRPFERGDVLHALKRIVAVSNVIDDDGVLNFYCFSNDSFPQDDIIAKSQFEDLPSIVNRLQKKGGAYWSGTSFRPVLADIAANSAVTTVYDEVRKELPLTTMDKFFNVIRSFFGKEPRKNIVIEQVPRYVDNPTKQLVLLITDGDNSDEYHTRSFFESMKNNKLYYFQCIGVNCHNKFLSKCAKDYPNVGYTEIDSFTSNDESMANALLNQTVLRHFGY